MVINIASFGGRSHLLDTARELEKFGHTVRFYSYVPTKRAMKFGLKKECSYSLFYWAIPFLILFKFFGHKRWITITYQCCFDYFTAYYMKPCDVFIGQSPMHCYCLKYVKRKYNAITILERGSLPAEIYNHNMIGDPALKGKKLYPQWLVKYENRGYEIADFISVGADHVKDAFISLGMHPFKIFVNNYGFNSSFFAPTELSSTDTFDIIQVGNWGYRKGNDLITEACKLKKYRFLHVGPLSCEFPVMSNMVHIDAQPENKLIHYYQKAKVFVMPSRVEGLALVQLQAIACGLPLVCSPYSGGRDLKKYVQTGDWIIELERLTLDELILCIDKALLVADSQKGKRFFLRDNFENVSWEGYGKRYNNFLKSIITNS